MSRCVPLLWSLLAAALPGQDDVLAVEKREDAEERDRAAVLLRRTRCDFVADAITPKDLCRQLAALTGDRITVVFAAKGAAATTPAFDLRLRSASAWSVMAAAQTTTGLRFVWRDGIVFLVGRDELRPFTYLQIYDLRAACMKLRSFPGPRLGLQGAEEEGHARFPPEEDSGTTVSGFTAEGVEALIKENVTPEAWADAASIVVQDGLFVVRQTPAGHRAIRELLDQLGLMPLPLPLPRTRPRR